MVNSPIYNIRFKCHDGMCYTKKQTSINLPMADNTAHAVACDHCGKAFYVEHDSAAQGFAWLHSGNHSRIISYKQVANG